MDAPVNPHLNQGNLIYLYQLLSRTIGCGRQTFITAVEEALATDRMGAEDLGFESTRSLLEALDAFVTLKVFKGGRIYVIVQAQPTWDAALASNDDSERASGKQPGKPWKKKKGDRALKPVRPKRVKRPEPEAAPAPDPEPDAGGASEQAPADHTDQKTAASPEGHAEMPLSSAQASNEVVSERAARDTGDAMENPGTDQSPAQPRTSTEVAQMEPKDRPAYSLTVTYDPYTGIAKETRIESKPAPIGVIERTDIDGSSVSLHAAADEKQGEPTDSPANPMPDGEKRTRTDHGQRPMPSDSHIEEPENRTSGQGRTQQAHKSQQAPIAQTRDTDDDDLPSQEALKSYPKSFRDEVYCPMDIVAELGRILPYGINTLGMLDEDYARACALELRRGNRSRVTFPLRVEHLESTEPILITLQRKSGSQMPWTIKAFE